MDPAFIDTESDPGTWADAIAHSPCLDVRDGRALAVHDVTVRQAEQPVAVVRVTTSAPRPDSLVWATDPFELPPAIDRCEPISPPEGALHFQHAEAVLDPAWRPFTNRDRAHVAGWVRPREAQPFDAAWLTMILDWFPPAAFARAQVTACGLRSKAATDAAPWAAAASATTPLPEQRSATRLPLARPASSSVSMRRAESSCGR